MTIVVQSGVLRSAASYVGAADLTNLTSPYAWCGLRAYKTSSIAAGNCVDIYDGSGNHTTTIGFGTNGLIKTTGTGSVQEWIDLYGSTVLVAKLYDQTGNNRGFTPTSVAGAPVLALTGGPINGPCIVFSPTGGANAFQSGSTYGASQPYAVSMVYRDPGTVNKISVSCPSDTLQIGPGGTLANELTFYAGASITATAADATWHSANMLANGASSIVRVNSTTTNGNAGTSNMNSGAPSWLGHYAAGGYEWGGKLTEFAVWSGDVSAEFAALSSNQHTAWGF